MGALETMAHTGRGRQTQMMACRCSKAHAGIPVWTQTAQLGGQQQKMSKTDGAGGGLTFMQSCWSAAPGTGHWCKAGRQQ